MPKMRFLKGPFNIRHPFFKGMGLWVLGTLKKVPYIQKQNSVLYSKWSLKGYLVKKAWTLKNQANYIYDFSFSRNLQLHATYSEGNQI